jgi:transketolase
MHSKPIGGQNMPAYTRIMPNSGKPLVILAHTDTTRGISLLKERYPKLHYVRFVNEEERNRYREVLEAWKS